jgi:hypothetical protein
MSQRTFTKATPNQSVNWGSRLNRNREDVSFLQEPLRGKPESFDRAISQSLITTGSVARDEYLQVALGMRSIGKSIVDLPRTIDDLKRMS